MASLSGAISHSSSHVALAHNTKPKKIHQSQCCTLPFPHRSPIFQYTSLFLHHFFPLVSRENWRNQYINLSLFFSHFFCFFWLEFLAFLVLNWAYSGVLLLFLGFRVGLKLELGVGLLLWLGFGVGLKLELGVGLKLEGSFPFLNWWCLVVQKRTEN